MRLPKLLQFILSIILFFLTGESFAQTSKITGVIRDSKDKTNLPGISIIAYNSSDTLRPIVYTTSRTNGQYSLELNLEKLVKLEFRGIGYETFSKIIELEKQITSLDINLIPSTTFLETIEIKAKIYADTVKFKTSDLNLSQDATLRTILGKSNGFEVTKSGGISYEGKPITKILINKKEVFINQNNTALDNINYDLISDFQVINNHKDKFKIDFENFKETVININTKKEFKGVIKVNSDLGYGYKDKFMLKSKGMYFSDQTNAFVTQNTNNIALKELSFEDLSQIYDFTSGLFKKSVIPFIQNEDGINKNFTNNTSVTFRKEEDKYKIGGTLYYNYLDESVKITSKKSANDILLNEDLVANRNIGNFFTAKAYLNYMPFSNTTFRYQLDFSEINRTDKVNLEQSLFIDVPSKFSENSIKDFNSRIMAHSLEIRSLISPKILSLSSVNYLAENTNFVYLTSITQDNGSTNTKRSASQAPNFGNNSFILNSGLSYQLSNLFSPSISFTFKNVKESLIQKAEGQTMYPYESKRIFSDYSLNLELRGQNKKIEYKLIATPTFKEIRNEKTSYHLLPIESFLFYKLNQNITINTSINNRYSFNTLDRTLDTLIQSFNMRIISPGENKNILSNSKDLKIGYSYNNISTSFSYNLALSLSRSYDYLERVFDRIEENTFYYNIVSFKEKKDKRITLGTTKGIYFSENFHKIIIKPQLSFVNSQGPAIVNSEYVNYSNTSKSVNLGFSFLPQNWFFEELSTSSSIQRSSANFNSILFNKQTTITNSININFHEDDHYDFGFSFKSEIFKTQTTNYQNIDFDWNGKYYLRKNLSLFITGKSLLNLFNITKANIGNYSVQTQDGLKTEVIRTSILGYMLFGINLKF